MSHFRGVPLVVFGAGGHASAVSSVAEDAGFQVVAFVADASFQSHIDHQNILNQIPKSHFEIGGQVIVAIGNNFERQNIANRISSEFGEATKFATVVHPRAFVSSSAKVGVGSVIMPFAYLAPRASLGEHCIMNSSSIVEHGAQLGNFSSIAPGAVMAGSSKLGSRSFLGMNSALRENTKIGDDVFVGAQSYVNRDLVNGIVAFGNPARYVRTIDTAESMFISSES